MDAKEEMARSEMGGFLMPMTLMWPQFLPTCLKFIV